VVAQADFTPLFEVRDPNRRGQKHGVLVLNKALGDGLAKV
jgi:hypothetical protein